MTQTPEGCGAQNDMPKPIAQEAIDAYGLDAICQAIADRKSLTAIAGEIGVSAGSLLTWIESTPERSVRVRGVRSETARMWDELAEEEIRAAENDLGLRKAKELAHHYRWRAAKIAPREYGEAVTLKGDKDNPLAPPPRAVFDLTDEELMALIAEGHSALNVPGNSPR